MNSRKKKLVVYLLIMLLVSSCVTSKKTTYLQSYDSEELPEIEWEDFAYRIKPGDNLFLRIVTPDPRWAEMFNTLPVNAAMMSIGEQSVDLISYTVQQDGTVDIPYLDKIEVAGKTLPQIKEIIKKAISDYVADAAVTVKLVNNYVSIIGDVNRPGQYPIYKEHLNIFQAIAMAGDLAEYSDRYNVKIIRQKSEGTVVKSFNLTDDKIIDSEFFYVMPNDVIYAQPMKGKFFSLSSFPYSIIISTITTGILLYNVTHE